MRRVLFRCGPLTVYSYPAFLYIGIVFGLFVELIAAERIHLDINRVLIATTLLLAVALFGARLLYVISNRGSVRLRLWPIKGGGAAMYGGLLVAVPLSPAVLLPLQLPFAAFWDVASFTMLVGLIFTRAGCLLNGCCAGRASSHWLAINLPNHKGEWTRRLPTQLLEALWGTLVLIGAAALWPQRPFPGALFLFAVGGYGAGRIHLEAMREDYAAHGRSVHRAIAAGCVAVSLIAFVAVWSR